MSETTIGTLFLAAERARVEEKLDELGFVYKSGDLNAKWGAAFLEDEFLIDQKTRDGLKEVSKVAPVLYFQSAEDYGWNYMLFDQGETVASVYVSYAREFYMTQELLEERYPDVDVIDEFCSPNASNPEIWRNAEAEVLASAKYQEAEERQYKHANQEAFRKFELTEEQLKELSEVVSLDYMRAHKPWDQVDAFKKILGIEEMSWQSYHFVRVDDSE